MLGWAILFLGVSLLAGFLGFSGIAGALSPDMKIIFAVFMIAFVLALIF